MWIFLIKKIEIEKRTKMLIGVVWYVHINHCETYAYFIYWSSYYNNGSKIFQPLFHYFFLFIKQMKIISSHKAEGFKGSKKFERNYAYF